MIKQRYLDAWRRTYSGIFIILSIGVSIGAANISTLYSLTASPLSIPLVCPNGQDNGWQDPFVGKDGTKFIYRGTALELHGYTFYPSLNGGSSAWHSPRFTRYIDHILDMGAQAGQNLARPTDFWNAGSHGQKQYDPNVWKNMDYLVCTARQRGIFVILDLSAFKWLLVSQGRDPYDARNWKEFLDFVGEHYIDQPSIAFYSIVGEPPPPTSVAAMNKLVDFYSSVTDELRRVDGNHHLIAAGGFNHMEAETPTIPWWQKIYSLPNNDIVAFKTYSANDLNLISKVSALAKELGKPLVDEEFGLPQGIGDGTYTGGAGYNGIKMSRAQFFEDVYSIGEENGVTGFVFWNMGCEMRGQSYEVNPLTPAVWQVVKKYAPNKPTAPDPKKPVC